MNLNLKSLAPVLASLFIAIWVGSISAQEKPADWPQFRGPGGMGISDAKGLPVTWSQTENMAWKTALPGAGTSSPIVVGDKIFLTCYSGFNVPGKGGADMNQLNLHTVCLQLKDGKLLWDTEVAPTLPEQARIRDEHGYASPTPAADDSRLYTFFGKSGVIAFDFSGKQLWRTDVGSGLHGWGSGPSVVLYGDLVIVNAGVESESLVALNKATGKEVWRVKNIRDAWDTPVLVPVKGKKPELVIAMKGKVLGFEPDTGKQLWTCNNDMTWYIVPSVVADNGIIWSLGGRSGIAAVALKAGGRGDVTATHRLWTGEKGSNVTSPVYHDGHLYWMSESKGIAYCAESMTGRIVYEEKIERTGQIYSSALLADGRIYYTNRGGRTFVVAAKPVFELLATNDLKDGSLFHASPAIGNNRLLIRSDLFLYCLGKK